MYQGKSIAGAARHITAICLAALVFALAPLSGAVAAQPAKSTAASEPDTTPAKVHEFLTLLADPKVQQWLEMEAKAKTAAGSALETAETSISREFDSRVAAIREHLVALGAALPHLPDQIAHAHGLISADLGDYGRIEGLSLLAVFVALGFGVEWLFRRATGKIRARLDSFPLATSCRATAPLNALPTLPIQNLSKKRMGFPVFWSTTPLRNTFARGTK